MLSTNSLAKNIVSERAERLLLSETAEVCVRHEVSSRAEIAIRMKRIIGQIFSFRIERVAGFCREIAMPVYGCARVVPIITTF